MKNIKNKKEKTIKPVGKHLFQDIVDYSSDESLMKQLRDVPFIKMKRVCWRSMKTGKCKNNRPLIACANVVECRNWVCRDDERCMVAQLPLDYNHFSPNEEENVRKILCLPCVDKKKMAKLDELRKQEQEASLRIRIKTEKFYSNLPKKLHDTEQPKLFAGMRCSICYDLIDAIEKDVLRLSCTHYFHKVCIEKWFAHVEARAKEDTLKECPLCKNVADMSSVLTIVSTKTVEDQKERHTR